MNNELNLTTLEQVSGGRLLSDSSMEKQMRLQMYMEPFNQAASMISNILKKLSQTSAGIISNLK